MNSSRDLDKLIKEYLSGNDDAFDLIYYATQKSVYLSIKLIIKNNDDVEDLMQDTYIKALANISKYQFGTNFSAWISRIARNNAINFYNKNKRVVLMEEIDVPDEDEKSDMLNYYLSFLDGLEKDIVIYKIILDMSYKEISGIIDKPISTIHDIYKRAIKRIKDEVHL